MATKITRPIYEELVKLNDAINDVDTLKKSLINSKEKIEEKYLILEKSLVELKNETKTKENYNNIESLYTFDSFFEFRDFLKNLYNVEKWKISNVNAEERIEILKDKEYFIKLKKDFNSKKLSPFPITHREILSYLDTLSILYQILNNIPNQDFKKNLKIIMEYVPKHNKGRDRCDYILAYKDILIILEFGQCLSRRDAKLKKQEKEKELNLYEDQIKKLIGSEIKIQKHAIIYMAEKDTESLEENFTTIKDAIELIKRWIKDAKQSAIDYLNQEE